MGVADKSIFIDQIKSGPVSVAIGSPRFKTIVEGNGKFDAVLFYGPLHIFNVPLEPKFRRVDSKDDQTLLLEVVFWPWLFHFSFHRQKYQAP